MNVFLASRRVVVSVAIAASWVAADHITKAWALEALGDGHVIKIIWILQFRLTFNTGSAFSVGSGFGPIIGLVSLAVVIALLIYAARLHSLLGLGAIGLIAGGAVGNVLDRVFRAGDGFMGGAVVDFIDLQWWPVFNVADIGIVVGAGLLLLAVWLEHDDISRVDQTSAQIQEN